MPIDIMFFMYSVESWQKKLETLLNKAYIGPQEPTIYFDNILQVLHCCEIYGYRATIREYRKQKCPLSSVKIIIKKDRA